MIDFGIWKTKCGLYVDPKHHPAAFYGGCYYMGVSYDVEHNSVLIPCAYREYGSTEPVDCEHREKSFDSQRGHPTMCAVSRTDEPYIYEQSIEKIRDDNDAEYYAKVRDLKEKNPLFDCCACVGRMGNKVKINYDLDNCLIFHPHGCTKPVCAVTGKKRDTTPVNIYCDTKKIVDAGTLTEHTVVTKGIKLLSRPIARECAERKLKEIKGWNSEDWMNRRGMTTVPHRIYISKRVGKDLLQDLRDAQEGIEVIHASDIAKKKKEAYRERKAKRKAAKERKIERQITENLKRMAFEGMNKDGEAVGDNVKRWAKEQLERRGIVEETKYSQGVLFE
jgi:hypothetical protein